MSVDSHDSLQPMTEASFPPSSKHTSPSKAAPSKQSQSYETDHQALKRLHLVRGHSLTYSSPLDFTRCLQGVRLRSVHEHRACTRICRPLIPLHTNATAGFARRICKECVLSGSGTGRSPQWKTGQDRLFPKRVTARERASKTECERRHARHR